MVQWRKEQAQEIYNQYIVLEWEEEKNFPTDIFVGSSVKRYALVRQKDRRIKDIFAVFCQAAADIKGKTAIFMNLQGTEEKEVSELAELLVQWIFTVSYRFPKTYSMDRSLAWLDTEQEEADVDVISPIDLSRAVELGRIYGTCINRARFLGDLPANTLGINEFISYARKLADKYRISFLELRKKELEELHCGGILSVNQGSREEAGVVVLRYKGDPSKSLMGLIGKAVMFDSGGYHLKDKSGMDGMKYDMCGGANILEVLEILLLSKAKANVLVVIPVVENMINENAAKMGDVIRTMDGRTVEILNTDAEGRLILCDAITYAKSQGCERIIDLATLTYSCQASLGNEISGIFSNQDDFYDKVKETAKAQGEGLWRLPIDECYTSLLRKSGVADLTNYSFEGYGGASIAAGFLAEFAGETPWVHLDVVGTAVTRKEKYGVSQGATGVMIRTLSKLFEIQESEYDKEKLYI